MKRAVCTCLFVAIALAWTATAVHAQQDLDVGAQQALRAAEEAAKIEAQWAARMKAEAAKPTPRFADGRPDLNGNWGDQPRRVALRIERSADGKTTIVHDLDAPDLDVPTQEGFRQRAADRARRPPYKPQHVAKQRELMYTASRVDPGLVCYPLGVPRLGAPTEIAQTPSTVYFFYAGQRAHRIIPIGGKQPVDSDPFPEGDSVARWEGDTLVVEVVNIDPETWLDGDGDFHSEQLRVVERLTRKGNTLDYEVIIEDPQLFTAPWKPVADFSLDRIGSRTMVLRDGAHDPGNYACVERDRDHKVNNDRF